MPNPLCDLFPPEFRYQCDPYCAAGCGPSAEDRPRVDRSHRDHMQQHLDHLEILEDPDLRPYIWEL